MTMKKEIHEEDTDGDYDKDDDDYDKDASRRTKGKVGRCRSADTRARMLHVYTTLIQENNGKKK